MLRRLCRLYVVGPARISFSYAKSDNLAPFAREDARPVAEYWFKRKRYGLGSVPSTWQGWGVTIAYLVGLFALCASLGPSEVHLIGFITLVTVLTATYLIICWHKTEGGWGWQWGDD